ncbi:hypothetical protein [Halovivax sp.]|uniref:DUF7556 family protein n=1 Tax=Halovivax sp. TaxID=1935978 RepID=UPI0025BC6DEC|nr:hypothetical protein [Halovivax sp.]
MVVDPLERADSTDDTVVASIDPHDAGDEYVIADISTDDAWLAMEANAAPALSAWR